MKRIYYSLLVLFFIARANETSAANGDYRSLGTGARQWDDINDWEADYGAGFVAAVDYPGQNPGTGAVEILDNTAMSMNGISPANPIGSLTFSCTANTNSLTFTANEVLTVTGAVTLNNTSLAGNDDINLFVDDGTLTCASIAMSDNTNGNYDCTLRIDAGTVTVTGSITTAGVATESNITFTNTGLLQVGGNMTGFTFTASTGTVEYNVAGAGNVGAYTYYNLEISAGVKTSAGAITVQNNFDISGGTFDPAGSNFNVNTLGGVTTIDGAYSDLNDAGVNTFNQDVTISATGTWTSTGETQTNGALQFSGDLTHNNATDGSFLAGGARFATNSIITSNGDNMDFANGFSGQGNLIINGGANGVTVSAGGITITTDLTIGAGASLKQNGTGAITVSGAANINGNFEDNSNSGTSTFSGLVTIGAAGTWNTTAETGVGLIFAGGIAQGNATAGSFLAGGCDFSADQSITGAGPISFANGVRVQSNRIVTNQNTNTISITGALTGQNAASQWTNDNGATLDYASTAEPMVGAVLDANNATNTIIYSSLTSAVVYVTTYSKLTINVGTSATIAGATVVDNTLTLTGGTFTVGGNLTMTNNATISRSNGSLSAAPTFGANVNVEYTAACVVGNEMPAAANPASGGVLDNLIMNTSGSDVTLSADVSMKGDLTWSSNGKLILSTFNLRMDEPGTFIGYGASKFIQTNSSGTFIKEGDATVEFALTYPLGTTTLYTPMQVRDVTSAAFGTPGTLTMRAVGSKSPYITVSNNAISKYWDVSSSFTPDVGSVDLTFTFDPVEVIGAVTLYEPRYGTANPMTAVTAPPVNGLASAAGTTPTFTVDNGDILTGTWTYMDPTIVFQKTYYSCQNGDWDDPTTWSASAGPCDGGDGTFPGEGSLDIVVIQNNTSVFLSDNRTVDQVTIENGGILDIKTYTSVNFGTIDGQGTLKINSVTLPTATITDFVSSTGGTIEYYDIGAVPTNLPDQFEYNNLKFSNSTGTSQTFIMPNATNPTTFNLNGDLTLSASGAGSTTLQLGYTATNIIDLTIDGDITNGDNCNITVGNFNAIHTISIGGNLTNSGTTGGIDLSNSAQYSVSTNGAATVTFTGSSADNVVTCNKTTDFYSITVNKGTDKTYAVDVTASAAANFRMFSGNPTPNFTLTNGTLKLGSGVDITRLGVTNAIFPIASTTRLWLNGAIVNSANGNVDDGLSVTGEFKVSGASSAITIAVNGIRLNNGGLFTFEDGTVNTEGVNIGNAGASDGTFNMSGGTLNVDVSYNGTLAATDIARFCMPDPNSTFYFSGGTINIKDPVYTAGAINSGGIAIGSSTYYASPTGGTINIWVPNAASPNHFGICSTAPFYNMNIYAVGANTATAKIERIGGDFPMATVQPLVIINDLVIGDGLTAVTLDANGNNVTVGGHFTIADGNPATVGGTYNPNNNTTTFNGTGSKNFTINNPIARKTTLVINKTGGGSVTLAGDDNINCLGGLTITAGTLADGGKTVDVCGNISNSGTHSGAGEIRVQRGVTSTNITGAGNYTLPGFTLPGGVTVTAQFDITIRDGEIREISVANGGTGHTNANNPDAVVTFVGGGGAGATARAEITGGIVRKVYMVDYGSGYGGMTVPGDGGGDVGSGVVFASEIVYTAVEDAGATAGHTLDNIYVVATGEGYDGSGTETINNLAGGATASYINNTVPSMGGGGSGTYANLTINNDLGATFTANQAVSGNLRLIGGTVDDAILNIDAYLLTLSATSNVYSDASPGTAVVFDDTKFIKTNGLSSAGGLRKTFSALGSFTWPIGSGTFYRPATISLATVIPTSWGYINVVPVAGEHPLTTPDPGVSLEYYWKTTTTIVLDAATVVNHTYTYEVGTDDTQGTVGEYVSGRYTSSNTTWVSGATTDVNTGTGVITFNTGVFNNAITGDYTCGDQTGTDPFGVPQTFYSKDGGPMDYNTAASWSLVSHTGAAAALVPDGNDIVQIGDGVTYFHDMVIDANTQSAGNLRIATGSSLDLGTTTGHDFTTYTTPAAGNGTILLASATFPTGDFATFIGSSGGTVEYYTNASSYTIPSSMSTYYNLTLRPEAGQTITMPDVDMTIYNDYTIGNSSFAAYTGTAQLNAASAKTLTITRDLNVLYGTLRYMNGFIQALTVGRDVTLSNGASSSFDVSTASATAIANTLSISRHLTHNGANFDMVGAGTDVCNVTFTSTTDGTISGTPTGLTQFNLLTVDKGTNSSPLLDVTTTTAWTVPTTSWFTLTNGTFKWNNAQTLSINSNVAGVLTIPATAKLAVNAGTLNTCFQNGNLADINLYGTIEITGGTMNVGNSANTNRNNDIEYYGTPTINILGTCTLNVNGQIRRETTVTTAALTYAQTGASVVVIRGQNYTAGRAKLEVDNVGSAFTMTGSSKLTIHRGGGTTYGDLYLRPATSTVSGTSTIFFAPAVAIAVADEVFTLNSNINLNNLTVTGFGVGDEVYASLAGQAHTFMGDVTISNVSSFFMANSFDVTFTEGGDLINNNTDGTAGVAAAANGYQPGVSTQTTTFSGTTGLQFVSGTGANLTNFGNLVINNSFGTFTLPANTAIRVHGNLTLSTALADGGNIVSVLGNITNNSTHSGAGRISLVGSSTQTIAGNGSGIFENIYLDNSQGTTAATLTAACRINGTLTFNQNGVLYINTYLLTFGPSAPIPAGYNSSRFIKTNGTLVDGGVIKMYSNGAPQTIDFTFPLGVGTNYRPAVYVGTATTTNSLGSVTVKAISSRHPSASGTNNVLTCYWNVDQSSDLVPVSITSTYYYVSGDVPGATNDNIFVVGKFDASSGTWNPVGGNDPEDGNYFVTEGSDLFEINTEAELEGDWTAGEPGIVVSTNPFAALTTYYSRDARTSNDWLNPNGDTWSTISAAGAADVGVGIGPVGNAVEIATGHTIVISTNTRRAASVALNGTAILDLGTTIGHNLGSVSGTGTLKITQTGGGSYNLPLGTYTDFVTAVTGGTVEYTGAGTGTLPTQATYNNLTLSGAGTKVMPTNDITINGNFELSAGTFSNAANNRNITVGGNWTNSGTIVLGATETVTFNGTTAASILGNATQTFYNLTLNKTGAGSLTTAAASTLNINKNLTITDGSFIAGAGSIINSSGDWSVATAGDFTPSTSTVNFINTTTTQTIGGTSASQTFYDVTLTKTSGITLAVGATPSTLTVNNLTQTSGNFNASLGTTLNINGNLVLTAGTFTTPTTTNIQGDWTVATAATFTPGTGTVNFVNTGSTQTIGGTEDPQTFYGLGLTKTAGVLLTLGATPNTLNVTNLTQTSGNIDLSGASSGVNIAGNVVRTAGTFTQPATVTFNGSAAQGISGAQATTFTNLVVNNTSATGLTLSQPVTVTTALTLTDGIVFTDATNLLILNSGSTSSSGSAASYVDGPMKKIGGTNFIFPLGDGGRWARLGINNFALASATTEYTAQYVKSAYSDVSDDGTLDGTSAPVQYWTLAQAVNPDHVDISLYWEHAGNSGIDNCGDLEIAWYDGGALDWTKVDATTDGSSVCDNGTGTGFIKTDANVSSYGAFAFGSVSAAFNPLPVELVEFKANYIEEEKHVDIIWTTASETNNDYFIIENTIDGEHYKEITRVEGNGTTSSTSHYKTTDLFPYSGISYYRLKQVDFNGEKSYSNLVAVNVNLSSDFDFVVFPNPNEGENLSLNISNAATENASLVIYNINGEKMYSQNIHINENSKLNSSNVSLPRSTLAPGIYSIVLTSGSNVGKQKLVVR